MQPGGDELGAREHQADTGVYSQRCKVRPTASSHICDQPPSFSTLSMRSRAGMSPAFLVNISVFRKNWPGPRSCVCTDRRSSPSQGAAAIPPSRGESAGRMAVRSPTCCLRRSRRAGGRLSSFPEVTPWRAARVFTPTGSSSSASRPQSGTGETSC